MFKEGFVFLDMQCKIPKDLEKEGNKRQLGKHVVFLLNLTGDLLILCDFWFAVYLNTLVGGYLNKAGIDTF